MATFTRAGPGSPFVYQTNRNQAQFDDLAVFNAQPPASQAKAYANAPPDEKRRIQRRADIAYRGHTYRRGVSHRYQQGGAYQAQRDTAREQMRQKQEQARQTAAARRFAASKGLAEENASRRAWTQQQTRQQRWADQAAKASARRQQQMADARARMQARLDERRRVVKQRQQQRLIKLGAGGALNLTGKLVNGFHDIQNRAAGALPTAGGVGAMALACIAALLLIVPVQIINGKPVTRAQLEWDVILGQASLGVPDITGVPNDAGPSVPNPITGASGQNPTNNGQQPVPITPGNSNNPLQGGWAFSFGPTVPGSTQVPGTYQVPGTQAI